MEDIIKIKVDSGDAVAEIETVDSAMKKLDNTTQETTEATKSLKAQIREATLELSNMSDDDPRRQQLINQIGEMKDKMADNAEQIKQQTGPAIEGLNSSFGIMKDQIMNLDFDGLANSLKGVTANLGRMQPGELTSGIKNFIQAGINGFKALGKAIMANPILLLVGIIAAIIAYWDDLVKLWNSSTLAALEKQLNNIKDQRAQAEELLTIEKARGKSAGDTLAIEFKVLRLRKEQADKEREIADLNNEEEARMKAQEESAKAIQEQRLLTAQTEAKINEAYRNALAFLDPAAKVQQEKENSVKAETDAINQANALMAEQSTKQSELNAKIALYEKVANSNLSISERANLLAKDGVISAEEASYQQGLANQSASNKEKIEAKLLNIANEKLGFLRYELQQSNGILSNTKNQLDFIIKAKQEKEKNFKTESELAAIEEAKRKAEERRQKAIEAQKKLNEDIKTIQERIAEIQRDGMSAQEKELFALQKKQEEETKLYEKAKKSEDDKQLLRLAHEMEYQAVLDKYDKEAEEADKAKREAERQAQQERLHEKQQEIIELQAIIDEADEANYQASLTQQQRELLAINDKYFAQIEMAKKAGLDTVALQEAQNRELDAVNDKYRKEQEQKDRALMDAKLELTSKGLSALSDLIGSFNIKDEKRAKKQFQIMKGIQMAAALIDTYKAITGALADTSPIPYYMKVANAAIAGATGFAQVAKIAQTSFNNPAVTDGGGGLNGQNDGGGGGGMQAPPIDFSFMQQTGQPNTVETYVLAGNVANALEARQKIIDQSHL